MKDCKHLLLVKVQNAIVDAHCLKNPNSPCDFWETNSCDKCPNYEKQTKKK
jgi:hypothetical protein